MSGVISFGDRQQANWFAAGWAFRQFLADLSTVDPTDANFQSALASAEALHGLHLDLIAAEDPNLAAKLRESIGRVAQQILDARSEFVLDGQTPLDDAGRQMYVESMANLLAAASVTSA